MFIQANKNKNETYLHVYGDKANPGKADLKRKTHTQPVLIITENKTKQNKK